MGVVWGEDIDLIEPKATLLLALISKWSPIYSYYFVPSLAVLWGHRKNQTWPMPSPPEILSSTNCQ